MNVPTGTVTFLFTDIEGSTRLWEEHPEAMQAALARHDALLRQAIGDNNGYVFKTVGDAFCAAFATAQDALAAALAAQCALVAEPWPDALSLRVRMALHAGAVEHRDSDYFGQPLNRTARLLTAAHGGQVLLSNAAQTLTRDALPHSAKFKNLGEHWLRDLEHPETVFQMLHPALPADFPPLKSLGNPVLPNNLPQQVTSFIGREKEIETVKSLLGKTRLLTLTGSGGCGKTRLGLQVAAEALENYPDGVWLVELAPLADPALVPQTVAKALCVAEEPDTPLLQTLVAALKTRHLLLVLDNCEHLLVACAQAADTLLRACPHVRVLASSREGLGIAGELTYRIPSLSLPAPEQTVTAASVGQYEAARLFIERALFHLPNFHVTDTGASALVSVCRRLDGIPLAIELAAARAGSLSLEEINSKLDNRFRLLTGGSRTALPRQQTLRAMIDWSYDLLTSQEKALLCRLSVFAGGWTLEAAEAVGAGEEIEEWQALDLLTSLVDKSLVNPETEEEHTRYRMLETVRQYARDRLLERGEAALVRERHQAFFVKLVEKAEPQLSSPDGAQWLRRLESEYDNFRAALEWSDEGAALRIAGALFRFWEVRGYYAEGRKWLAATLASEAGQARTPARAKALNAAGVLARSQGDYAAAQPLHEQSLALYQELGDKQGIAHSFLNLGYVAGLQGDYKAARPLFEQGLALSQEVGNRWIIARSFLNLGLLAYVQGEKDGMRPMFEQSLVLYRELGDKQGIAFSLNNLGLLAYMQGDCAAAQSLYAQSLTLYRELKDKQGAAYSLLNLGNVACEQGEYAAARDLFAQSLALSQEMGDKWTIVNTLESFASLASLQGQAHRAAQLWGAEEAFREVIGSLLPPSERPRYDRQVPLTRSAMGESLFAAAWTQGRAMTMEQAIAYALEK